MTAALGFMQGLVSGWLGSLSLHQMAELCLVVVLAGLFLLRLLARLAERAIGDAHPGFLKRLLMLNPRFSEAVHRQQRLPNLFLLHHWRDAGEVKRAYRTAKRNLVKREEALPIWLFAAETAAVHLDKWSAAIRIVQRLCRCPAFNEDEKIFVVNHLKGLAATQGLDLDIQKLRGRHLQRPRLTALKQATRLREQGQSEKAISLLKEMLQRNPENLAAGVMLVRIYAQDLHRRDQAEQVIAQLEKQHCGSRAVIDFLSNSLEEWLQSGQMNSDTAAPLGSRAGAPPRVTLVAPPITREMDASAVSSTESAADSSPEPATEEGALPEEIALLVREGRLGTAVQQLELQIRQDPHNLGVILQLVHVEVVHCRNLRTGERIVTHIDCCPDFTEEQKALALAKLRLWREELAHQACHPMSVRML